MKPILGGCAVLGCALALSVSPAQAAIVSVNFVDDPEVDTMLPTDVAGVTGGGTRVANWNNVVAGAVGTATGFIYDSGATSNAILDFTTDLDRWRLPTTDLAT